MKGLGFKDKVFRVGFGAGFADGFAQEIAGQKGRLFLWIPVAFAAGIALYFSLLFEPDMEVAPAMIAALIPCTVYLYRRHHDSLCWFFGYLGAMGLLFAALGFGAAQMSTALYGTPLLKKSIGPVDVVGDVESIEHLGGKDGARVVLTHLSIEKIAPEDTPRKVRLRFRKDEGLSVGARIKTLARIDAPSGPVMPGAYDFRRHLFFQGIGGVGFSFRQAEVIETNAEEGLFFERLRQTIEARINEKAGAVSAGIMTALITGGRGAIAEDDDDAMRESGLYHLLSISGTHVAMVAGVLFFMSRLLMAAFPWVALHWPIKKIAAFIALIGAAFYVMLAGADVPAQRALIMTGLVMVAVMFDRSPVSLRLIAFSALVVLIIAPYALTGVSFQMSYAAVAALICFFDYIRPWWMAWHRQAGIVRKAILYVLTLSMTSVIAGTVTGLLSLYHFQAFQLYGVLSNMIAVPLTGVVIMPAAVVALFLMPFGMDGFALQVMEWGTLWMLAVAHWTAGLDGAVIHATQWPDATFVCIVVSLTLFLVWHGWRGKGVAMVVLMIGLIAAAFHPLPDVIVSGTGKQAAVRGENGDYYFLSGRKEKFAAENWLRLAGHEGEKPKTFKDASSPVLCDDAGCRGELGGWKIAIAQKPQAVMEDCAWADILIAEIPTGALCPKETTYGLFDFRNKGAHTFYLSGKDIRVRTVAQSIGVRPWSARILR